MSIKTFKFVAMKRHRRNPNRQHMFIEIGVSGRMATIVRYFIRHGISQDSINT